MPSSTASPPRPLLGRSAGPRGAGDDLRLAFDGDSVVFSDEAEQIFQEKGLDAFSQMEAASASRPLGGGPFRNFLAALHDLQREFAGQHCPIRTALVTARGAPAHERVIRTLRAWDVRLDESLFLGGMDKTEFLRAFGADVFFDDQSQHCDRARLHVTAGHVPHGIAKRPETVWLNAHPAPLLRYTRGRSYNPNIPDGVMKLQQLRYIWEVAHHDLNVSATAQSLFTSQPGISKQIRLLEDELGVEIFARSGKHLTHVTTVGETIIAMAGQILREVDAIKQVAQEFSDEKQGSLSIATTHNPGPLRAARGHRRLPGPLPGRDPAHEPGHAHHQIAELAAAGSVDFAIATEGMEHFQDLVMMPCYAWNRCVVVPEGHRLADQVRRNGPLTLEDVAREPIVTYVFGFTGRSRLDAAFSQAGLSPNVVFTATDTDVIKTYVRLGLGVGIIARMALDAAHDADLVPLDASHLFEPSITHIGFRKGDVPAPLHVRFHRAVRAAPDERPGGRGRRLQHPGGAGSPVP